MEEVNEGRRRSEGESRKKKRKLGSEGERRGGND